MRRDPWAASPTVGLRWGFSKGGSYHHTIVPEKKYRMNSLSIFPTRLADIDSPRIFYSRAKLLRISTPNYPEIAVSPVTHKVAPLKLLPGLVEIHLRSLREIRIQNASCQMRGREVTGRWSCLFQQGNDEWSRSYRVTNQRTDFWTPPRFLILVTSFITLLPPQSNTPFCFYVGPNMQNLDIFETHVPVTVTPQQEVFKNFKFFHNSLLKSLTFTFGEKPRLLLRK